MSSVNWDDVVNNGWKSREEGSIRILSIDGGGIRGIFPAKYLARIEADIGDNIYKYFDMIVGTSTGGIIALGLSLGISANDIANLYIDNCSHIFKNNNSSLSGWTKSKYKNTDLTRILKTAFEEHKLEDSFTMLCIPSLEHQRALPKVYKTRHLAEYHVDHELPMWKVALATSAAPIYFPAVSVTGTDCKIDGGLWANNPILVGIAEAAKLGYKSEQIKILSIGTGRNVYDSSNKVAFSGGLLNYKKSIVDLTMNAQTESSLNIARYLIKENNLKRIDFTARRKMELDTTKEEDISEMIHEGDKSFENTFRKGQNIFKNFFEL